MSEEDPNYSVIDYVSGHDGYRCGYCKSDNTSFSHGMWAYKLTVGDYQDLIDRGWRRSGQYCYKPTMNKTCCPQYTIKCDALNFKPSKSQRKVLKQMHSYLSYGTKKSDPGSNDSFQAGSTEELIEQKPHVKKRTSEMEVCTSLLQEHRKNVVHSLDPTVSLGSTSSVNSFERSSNAPPFTSPIQEVTQHNAAKNKTSIKSGVGPDPSKPLRKKAKILRMERRAKKRAIIPIASTQDKGKENPKILSESKSLEDFLNARLPESPAHRLELRLVRVDSSERRFKESCSSSYDVFRRYQMSIHGEVPEVCQESSYRNFLVDGPLTPWKPCKCGPPCGYGPFHQQYWLDGALIAVGVLDVLPHSVSSVYLFYDPKFAFLSLGTYSSLREIGLTRSLNKSAPLLKWYYMGFYIHSCLKMRYKGNYSPSYILCPETFDWVYIENCRPKLDVSRYSRLCNSPALLNEELDVRKVLCLYKGQPFLFGVLRSVLAKADEDKIVEYLSFVGAKLASSILYYWEDSSETN